MSTRDISTAKNPDLRASLTALQRAGQLARKAAVQADSCIVIVQDGQLIHLSASELRTEEGITNELTSPRRSLRSTLKQYADPDRIAPERIADEKADGSNDQ